MTHSYKRMGHFLFYENINRGKEYGHMEREVPLFHTGLSGNRIGRENRSHDFHGLPNGGQHPESQISIYTWSNILF